MSEVPNQECRPSVQPLGPDTEPDARFGGKGRALAELVRAGYPVPPAGVVTADVYRQVADQPPIRRLIDRIMADEAVPAEEVDAAFQSIPVPEDLCSAIVEVGSAIGGNGFLAVRSSATVEDLHGSSFAGQYRTVLDVDSADPEAVIRAVRQVWASLWHPAPAAYRRAFGIPEDDVAMAVVMMRMVPASQAGVVFTVDPSGSGGARVEAVDGLGDALVSGERTPSAWVVPILDDRSADPDALADLPPPAGRALKLALEAEQTFGVPQDVEWAEVDGHVSLVQARPITVLGDDDGFDTEIDDHELTTAGIVEMVPGVLPPLRWDLNRFLLEEGFRSVLDSLGVIRGHRAEDRWFVRRVRGRAAIDFDQLRAVASRIPGATRELELQYFGRAEPTTPESGRPRRPTRRRRRLAGLKQELRTLQTRGQVIDQAEMVVLSTSMLAARRPDLTLMSDVELVAYVRRLVDLAARGMAAELGVAAAAGASYRRLESILTGHLGADSGAVAAQKLVGGIGSAVGRRRSASAAVFAGPTWDELGSTPPVPVVPSEEELEEKRVEVEAELKALPGWTRRRVLTGQFVDTRLHLVRRTARDVVEELKRREAAKGAILELGGEVRRSVFELADRLVEREELVSRADVELLSSAELVDVVHGRSSVTLDVLGRRRNWLSRYEAEGVLPVRFSGIPDREPDPLPEGDLLTGWAASPGRARGRARVVGSPKERFERGEVLVAETTDASWSPLFVRAAAVVVERGGPLSHAAILARELGLPAVLNLTGATGVLDGSSVLVDGIQGVVVVEEREGGS